MGAPKDGGVIPAVPPAIVTREQLEDWACAQLRLCADLAAWLRLLVAVMDRAREILAAEQDTRR
jgi:hypothetical protein